MSLFSWLSAGKKKPVPPPPETSGLSRMEATRPFSAKPQGEHANGVPGNRKAERMAMLDAQLLDSRSMGAIGRSAR